MNIQSIEPCLIRSEAILAVKDVVATVDYYQRVLGFTDEWLWGEPPDFGGVSWGSVGLMFSQNPEIAAGVAGFQHYFHVSGVDALYERHQAAGAEVVPPLPACPWGMPEYALNGPDSYVRLFGEPGTHRVSKGLNGLPHSIRIEERKPTVEEFLELVDAVDWSMYVVRQQAGALLEQALFGAVAVDDAAGRTVAAGLVDGNRMTFYHLNSVMVLPSHQGRRIGSAIVAALMGYLRREAPDNSLVALFTGHALAPFYAQFGFVGPHEGVLGMSQRLRRPPSAR